MRSKQARDTGQSQLFKVQPPQGNGEPRGEAALEPGSACIGKLQKRG